MTTANYILLDAARMNGAIQQARALNPDHSCLYEGDSEKFLAAVAPWLFSFAAGSEFAQWVVQEGRRNGWGILFASDVEPVRLYKHLRRFLIVQTDEGREMYFRYYDPRVLRAFLPTCDQVQLKEFFGPITAFLAEDENGLLVEYALAENEFRYSELKTDIGVMAAGAGAPLVRTDQVAGDGGQLFKEVPPPDPAVAVGQAPDRSRRWDFGF